MTQPNVGDLGPAFTVTVPTTGASLNVIARAAIVFGFAFRETTGVAPASFDLLDGNDVNGELVVPVNLSAGESVRDILGGTGVFFESGPFLRVNSGSIQGCLWQIDVGRDAGIDIANRAS